MRKMLLRHFSQQPQNKALFGSDLLVNFSIAQRCVQQSRHFHHKQRVPSWKRSWDKSFRTHFICQNWPENASLCCEMRTFLKCRRLAKRRLANYRGPRPKGFRPFWSCLAGACMSSMAGELGFGEATKIEKKRKRRRRDRKEREWGKGKKKKKRKKKWATCLVLIGGLFNFLKLYFYLQTL